MNVLIYSGPGTTTNCVDHCLNTFRILFSPYYAVSTVNEKVLKDQPWESKTALLIIPGGADLPICSLFKGKINDRIKAFVNKGGKYIGICSGAYYSSSRCEFEVGNPTMEVSGPRELKFFPGICRGGAMKGFAYDSEKGSRVVEIEIDNKKLPSSPPYSYAYLNGGGMFVDAAKYSNVQVLATYKDKLDVEDTPQGTNAATVLCTVGRGKSLLFGPHPEFDPYLMKEDPQNPSFTQVIKSLKDTNKSRIDFLREAVKTLDLKVNEKEYERPKLTPLFYSSIDDGKYAEKVLLNLEEQLGFQIQNIMDIGNDKLEIHKTIDFIKYIPDNEHQSEPALEIKKLYLCQPNLPSKSLTPYFNMDDFKHYLIEFYKNSKQELTPESLGYNFIYGDVVTSTSILIDNNFKWLPLLPSGFTITATVQVMGKGRSGNCWVNPKGVLPVSTLLKIPQNLLPTTPIVFVQYLSSLAFTRAVLEYDEGYDEIPMKIKWPNDIYIKLPKYIGKTISPDSKEVTHVKIAGILVNTNILNGNCYLIVGAGLNVSNTAPSTSVNTIISALNEYYASIGSNKKLEPIQEEKLLAKYLTIFNNMFEKFKHSGFEPFLPEYYRLWFHSNQIVTLNDMGGVKAKICGITSDWGMLLAKDLKTGETFQLQPDGNSFDMFNGLISKKR